jgi:hypothetical protein
MRSVRRAGGGMVGVCRLKSKEASDLEADLRIDVAFGIEDTPRKEHEGDEVNQHARPQKMV